MRLRAISSAHPGVVPRHGKGDRMVPPASLTIHGIDHFRGSREPPKSAHFHLGLPRVSTAAGPPTFILDVDGREWPEVANRDPAVARLQTMFPGFRPVNWSNAYEAAAWCLISSRIAMRQAQTVKERMCRELGASVDIHGHRLYCFPGPEALIHLQTFKGLFGRKVEYLNGLGDAALGGEIDTETLRAMSHEKALETLQRLKGIGEI